jgi:hypothetical protein
VRSRRLANVHESLPTLDLCGVVVHLDLLDLEHGVGRGRTSGPALVTVGPVVPDPRAWGVGHILSRLPLLDTIDVEDHGALSPVDTVLMLGVGRVRRRINVGVGRLAVAVLILVGEPNLAGSLVGLGVGIGEPFDVALLLVVLVEEHTWTELVHASWNSFGTWVWKTYHCRHQQGHSE